MNSSLKNLLVVLSFTIFSEHLLLAQAPGGVAPNLKLWLKQDAGVTLSGRNVLSWADQSPSAFLLNQTQTVNQPAALTLTKNFGETEVAFYWGTTYKYLGSTKEFFTPQVLSAGDLAVFMVYRFLVTDNFSQTLLSYLSDYYALFLNDQIVDATTHKIAWYNGSSLNQNFAQLTGNFYAGEKDYLLVSCLSSATGTHTGSKRSVFNRGVEVLKDNNIYTNTAPGSSDMVTIGAGYNKINMFGGLTGAISEIIVYNNKTLMADEFNKIQSYLAIKYGFTLDQTTPRNYIASNGTIVWNASQNTAFNKEIIIIGRDDASGLNQKQSTSASEGGILSVGLGGQALATKNSLNTGTFATNLSFFSVAARAGVVDSYGVTDYGAAGPTAIVGRIEKAWMVQETPAMGPVRLSFNLSKVAGPGFNQFGNNNLADVRLLVDKDGIFKTGATAIAPASFNNSTGIVDFNFDFNNLSGYYFTLGTINKITAPLPVEMESFSYACEKKRVVLKWTTASEVNNREFVVQGSEEGTAWNNLTIVPGAGTSKMRTTYSREIEGAYRYFRLKQIDNDTTVSYSEIIAVNCPSKQELSVFPNPCAIDDELHFIIPDYDGEVEVEFYTLIGLPVSKFRIIPTNHYGSVSTHHLREGTYFIKFKGQGLSMTEKIYLTGKKD